MSQGFPSPNDNPGVIEAQVIPETAAPRRPRVFGKLLLLFVLLALGGSVVMNFMLATMLGLSGGLSDDRQVQEKHFSHTAYAQNKVVIITIDGMIVDGEGFAKRQIEHAGKDPNVKAVVLRVNSPGGSVAGSDALYHRLRKLADRSKVPIVVSMGALAASGGYYVSMAVGTTPDTIFAEPSTWTGSIGVMIPHYSLSDLFDRFGVKEDTIVSHRLKTMGSYARPMTEEERKIFQSLVDESFTRFKEIIQSGRPRFAKDAAALEKLATGQIFTAQQAKNAGLVDKIGFVEDAVQRAIELSGISADEINVVKYQREVSLASVFFGSESRAARFDLNALLEMATPRAYFLCTSLPALAASWEMGKEE